MTGPSAGGKSTVGPRLATRLADQVVVLEQDLLWVSGLRDDIDGHPRFRSAWLRLAAAIHQGGLPVVLCGTVVPAELEALPERVFFTDIHYLALVADGEVLAKRLRRRPSWRGWDEPRVQEMLEFTVRLRTTADGTRPPVPLVDTSSSTLDETVDTVVDWVHQVLSEHQA